jgi:hypothetical protein
MTMPSTFTGIIAAMISNSRLVRTRKPGADAQCRDVAPATRRVAKT